MEDSIKFPAASLASGTGTAIISPLPRPSLTFESEKINTSGYKIILKEIKHSKLTICCAITNREIFYQPISLAHSSGVLTRQGACMFHTRKIFQT
jgi:hypothetical protein